ncbi:condensin subunit ScpA [Andreprevotia lacus DSM 23236]|jgi:segregation and condensation protein A|uniref:Segregation and condensation protein A n=1 Tax=Andreprevotia lacus DSM 23236 TaxID=1121001 RepID=A0A1W1XMS8_9NEIS|nr:ScpA family protein [Andreprevotia lacus]SMC24838.1 condensin subunit ScpA [Andreprevotia lacus DSM 23236]
MSDVTELLPASSAAPLAHVLGEPVNELPLDLYIPPDALRVLLESFEGPLDLLLYLIRKQNLDILDIPMAEVTRQYMKYIEAMKASQLELAAEYLLMAAVLIEIKSRLLLPRPSASEDNENDPRAELVRRLLEYEQMKLAAFELDQLPQAGRDFQVVAVLFEREMIVRLPDVSAADLRAAWQGILARAKRNQHHKIATSALSVREQMSAILKLLQDGRFARFETLFDTAQGIPLLVVTFSAVLELVKEKYIVVSQDEGFAPIYVRLSSAEESHEAIPLP